MAGQTIIFVTGGAGYIGSHTCKALAEAGFLPVTVDNLVYGHRWAVKWGPLEVGDVGDPAFMGRVFEKYGSGWVIHFAAYAYVGESVSEPGKYYSNNVCGTINLLEAMRAAGCPGMVFSSTCATYGIPEQMPITEQTPQMPINPYGRTKLMIERILADYDAAYGIRHACLRYFNAAGADPDAGLGEDHDPETHLIPLAIQAAMGHGPKLKIFGQDYPTQDGTAIRDYIHVNDLADAHLKALERLVQGRGSGCFNLGSGRGHSVLEVVDAVSEVSGRRVPTDFGPRRPGDPAQLVAGVDLAARELGWTARHIDLTDIVRSAWRWHKGRNLGHQ